MLRHSLLIPAPLVALVQRVFCIRLAVLKEGLTKKSLRFTTIHHQELLTHTKYQLRRKRNSWVNGRLNRVATEPWGRMQQRTRTPNRLRTSPPRLRCDTDWCSTASYRWSHCQAAM